MNTSRVCGQKDGSLRWLSCAPSSVSARKRRSQAGVSRLRHIVCTAGNGVQVSEQKLPNSRIRLTLTTEPSFNKECFETVIGVLREETTVAGFRKGKPVPLPLLYSAAGGEAAVKGKILEAVIDKAVSMIQAEYSESAIEDSDSLDTSINDMIKSFDVERPFVFDVSFDVLDPVKWKSPYEDIRVEVHASGDDTTDEADVNLQIKQMLKEKAINRVVAHRGMARGDLGIMDIDFIRVSTNESIPGMRQEKFAFDTDMKDDLNLFSKLKGMRLGEEREFNITFPSDWEPRMYRGVEAKVITNMRELFEWELPEFDDDFLKSVDPNNTLSAEEFREQLLAATKAKRIQGDDYKVQDAICEALASIVDMVIAEKAIQETGKSKYMDQLIRMQTKGKLAFEAVQQLATPEMVKTYIDSNRAELENYQRAICALDTIVKEKKLFATEEEIEVEFNQAKQEFEESNSDYDEDRLRPMCKEVLETQKVIKWFKDNGCVQMLPPLNSS